ncbi:MAG: hypothetical protein QOI41_6494 [Myxococcales bacterium]|nr:hypothetical protein [Myxococcales bacterium]
MSDRVGDPPRPCIFGLLRVSAGLARTMQRTLSRMKRSALVLGFSVAVSALGLLAPRDAEACGGCFHPPTQVASDITDERMLLSVSTKQTTLYDQIRYSGSPSSFAWVLPIHGTVDVGLSADVLFGSIDTLTATQINPPPANCPAPPSNCNSFGAKGGAGTASPSAPASDGVSVTKQENVGPYATVQLHPTTTMDDAALEKWLSDNGFQIPADVMPIIHQYVSEGFDFLAMKLLPNQGIQAMRPVRVTAPGASLALPLRMAAIGTGVSVGITIWVVGDGRYQPQNFPFYRIEDKDMVWDWSTSSSNYTTLRSQNEANLQGKGWEIESSLTLNQQLVQNTILSGGVYYGGGGVGPQQPSQASADYLPIPGDDAGTTQGKSADEVRAADVAALFAGMNGPNVRITRMRSDISHAAMTSDFILQASPDQSEITNIHNLTNAVNLQCPVYDGCNIVGQVPADEANARAASNNGSSNESFGCTTTSKPFKMSDLSWPLSGVLGMALALRVLRIRKNRKPKG